MTLRRAWDAEAERWVAWARDRRDSYWKFHARRFLELLPPPCTVVDVGCGEGRLPRDLRARGYRVVGVDTSAALVAHARAADPEGDYRVADAAALPLADASVELVSAFMALQDMDDMPAAVREAGRVLAPGGCLCLAVLHPLASAGDFEGPAPDARFVLRGSYFERRRWADTIARDDGLAVTFHGEHRPLATYTDAIAAAGLLVERLVELPDETDPPGHRWRRLPLFLQVRAVKVPRSPRP